MATDEAGRIVLRATKSKRGKVRGTPGSRSFVTALNGCEDTTFLDFIRRCLKWLPEDRMTPRDAFRHEWLRRRLPKPPGCANTTSSVTSIGNTWTNNGPRTHGGVAATVTHPTVNGSVTIPNMETATVAASANGLISLEVRPQARASPTDAKSLQIHPPESLMSNRPTDAKASTTLVTEQNITGAKQSVAMDSTRDAGDRRRTAEDE